MNRYTFLEYKPGLFRGSRVYKFIYTLSSIAFIESALNIQFHEIKDIKPTKKTLAIMVYAGLIDQHNLTMEEADRLATKCGKDILPFIQNSIEKSLPKIEDIKEKKKEDLKETPTKSHWEFWEEYISILKLTPMEAEKMTPRELAELVKAYADDKKNIMRLVAWHLVHIINMFSKTPVTVDELLGEEKQVEPSITFDEWWNAREKLRAEYREKQENV